MLSMQNGSILLIGILIYFLFFIVTLYIYLKKFVFLKKDCQKNCWSNGHKILCGQSQDILSLSLLPRYDFNGDGFRFRESKPNEGTDILSKFSSAREYPLLPKYAFNKAMVARPVIATENKVLMSSINKSPQKLSQGLGEKKKMPNSPHHTPSKKLKDCVESKENMECN